MISKMRLLCFGIASIGLLLGPVPRASSQTSPGLDLTLSRDSSVIRGQLAHASELGRRVVKELQNTPPNDSVPLDEGMLKSAHDTYALIRAARHGISMAREREKFPDPLKDLAFQRVEVAWNLSRTPVDLATSRGTSRQEYLQRSVHDLSRAIQLVDQALILMP